MVKAKGGILQNDFSMGVGWSDRNTRQGKDIYNTNLLSMAAVPSGNRRKRRNTTPKAMRMSITVKI
jgi:hypothetical protein